jgi:hypothetical protein
MKNNKKQIMTCLKRRLPSVDMTTATYGKLGMAIADGETVSNRQALPGMPVYSYRQKEDVSHVVCALAKELQSNYSSFLNVNSRFKA